MLICPRNGFAFYVFLLITKMFGKSGRSTSFLKSCIDGDRLFDLLLIFFVSVYVMKEKLQDQIFIEAFLTVCSRKVGVTIRYGQYCITRDINIFPAIFYFFRLFIGLKQNIRRGVGRTSGFDDNLNVRI